MGLLERCDSVERHSKKKKVKNKCSNDNYNSITDDTINTLKLEIKHFYDNYNLVYSDTTTTFQLFDFLVWTNWACLKGVTSEKTFKEESTNKNHYDDHYSAPFACRSFVPFFSPNSLSTIFKSPSLLASNAFLGATTLATRS